MNKFYIYTGIILMTISFFIPTIMKSEVGFVLNNLKTVLIGCGKKFATIERALKKPAKSAGF